MLDFVLEVFGILSVVVVVDVLEMIELNMCKSFERLWWYIGDLIFCILDYSFCSDEDVRVGRMYLSKFERSFCVKFDLLVKMLCLMRMLMMLSMFDMCWWFLLVLSIACERSVVINRRVIDFLLFCVLLLWFLRMGRI